ncbi:MAG TPA: hypothetical protein VFZ34_18560, partial [Blastocatellia bacterium]|nr:hypothetical protein [Blastocatellia bacterium]
HVSQGKTCGLHYSCRGRQVSYQFGELDGFATQIDNRAQELAARLPELRRLQQKIVSDQKAIRQLGFETTTAEILEWENLVTADRADRLRETKLALLDTAFLAARHLNDVTHNPKMLEEIMADLKSPLTAKALRQQGINAKQLIDHLVKLNVPQSKQLRAQLLELTLDKLGKIKDAVTVSAPDNEQLLKVLAMSLGWLNNNPQLQLLVTELQLATRYVYSAAVGQVAKQRINQLNRLTEKQLLALKRLTELLVNDTKALQAAYRSLPDTCLLS